MRIRIQRGGILQAPTDIEGVDGVVICTDAGVPVTVAKDMEGKAYVSKAGDKGYALMLESLGYRRDEVPELVSSGG